MSFAEALRKAAKARGAPEKKLERDLHFIVVLRSRVMKHKYMPTDKEHEGYFRALERVLSSLGFDLSHTEST